MQKVAIDHETNLVKRSRFDRWAKAFTNTPEEDRFREAEVWLNTGYMIIRGEA